MIQSHLLRHFTGYIAGKWIEAGSLSHFAVNNPATGEHIADVTDMTGPQTTLAIESAESAWKIQISPQQRRDWLIAIYDQLLANQKELAQIITTEQGKPLKESAAEVEYAAGFFQFA